ncbi:hypothetical protein [Streptomyces sp. NPDC002324]
MAAAWEAFDVAVRVADAAAFEEGSDELQALLAAQVGAEGRNLLPLPERGQPIDVPPLSPGVDGFTPYVSLLRRAQTALERLAVVPGETASGQEVMQAAAGKAATAAGALLAVREQ